MQTVIEHMEELGALLDSHALELRMINSNWRPGTPISNATWRDNSSQEEHDSIRQRAASAYDIADKLRAMQRTGKDRLIDLQDERLAA